MKLYNIPWVFRNGKKIRWLSVWADTIAQAVTTAHKKIEVNHKILVERIRNG